MLLEGTGSVEIGRGTLTPTIEAGLRYDGGDAETGAGLEIGGGLGYSTGRLKVHLDTRELLVHQATGYQEWGLSGSVAYTPDPDGRGLNVRLGSSWGNTRSGVQALWSHDPARGLGVPIDPGQPVPCRHRVRAAGTCVMDALHRRSGGGCGWADLASWPENIRRAARRRGTRARLAG